MNIIKLTNHVKQRAEDLLEWQEENICKAFDSKFNYAGRGILFTRLSDSEDERSYGCLCMNIWSQNCRLKLVGIKDTPGAFLAIDCVPVKLQTYQTVLEHGERLKGNWGFVESYSNEINLDPVDYIQESEIYQEEREERENFNRYWMEQDTYNMALNKMSQERENLSIVSCKCMVKENLLHLSLEEERDCYTENMLVSFRESKVSEWRLLGIVTEKKNNGMHLTVEVLNEHILLDVLKYLKQKNKSFEIRMDDRGTKVRLKRQRTALNNLYYHNTANPELKEILEDYGLAELEDTQVDFYESQFEDKQNEALQKVLSAKDIALIQGPPGTGKTTVISRLIQEIVKENKTVLVASATHVAVDNVLQRIGTFPGVYAVRIGKAEKIEEDCTGYLFDTYVDTLRNRILDNISAVNAECRNIQEMETKLREQKERYEKMLPVVCQTQEAKLDYEEAEKKCSVVKLDLKSRENSIAECRKKLDQITVVAEKEKIEKLLEKLLPFSISQKQAVKFAESRSPEEWKQTGICYRLIKQWEEQEKKLLQIEESAGREQDGKTAEERTTEAQKEKLSQIEAVIAKLWHTAKEKGCVLYTDASPQNIISAKAEYDVYKDNLSKLAELVLLKNSYREVRGNYMQVRADAEQYDGKLTEITRIMQEYEKKFGSRDYWVKFLQQYRKDPSKLQKFQKAVRFFGAGSLPFQEELKEACLFTGDKLEKRRTLVEDLRILKNKQEDLQQGRMQLQLEISSLEMELEQVGKLESYRNTYREHLGQTDRFMAEQKIRNEIAAKKQEQDILHGKEQEYASGYKKRMLEKRRLESDLDRYYLCLSKWKNDDCSILDIAEMGKTILQTVQVCGLNYEEVLQISGQDMETMLRLETEQAALIEKKKEKLQMLDTVQEEYQKAKQELERMQKQLTQVLCDMNIDDSLSNCHPASQYEEIIHVLEHMLNASDEWQVWKEELQKSERNLEEYRKKQEEQKAQIAELKAAITQCRQQLPEKLHKKAERECFVETNKVFIQAENSLGKEFSLIWYMKEYEDIRRKEQLEKELEVLMAEQKRLSDLFSAREKERILRKEPYETLLQSTIMKATLQEFPDEDLCRIIYQIEDWLKKNSDILQRGKELLDTKQIRQEWEQGVSLQKEFLEERCISMANVVCATCSGIVSNDNQYFQNRKYDYVIIDEAAKCDTLDMLIPMTMGRKIVLVGDHKQLKPVLDPEALEKVQEDLAAEFLESKDSGSLFQKIFMEIDDSMKTMLNVQYRMAPQIAQFISSNYYNNQLDTAEGKVNDPLVESMFGHSMVWFDSGMYDRETKVGNSYGNEKEAALTRKLLQYIDDSLTGNIKKQVGIIAPYRGQIQLITQMLKEDVYEHLEIECNTVDAFQGREKDYIIMNYVRNNMQSKVGFSVEDERMNVAISRSRELFVMVASTAFVEMNAAKMKSMYPLYLTLKQEGMIKNERFLMR